MQLIPLQTKCLAPGDDLLAALLEGGAVFQADDILVLSSKIVATCEGRVVDLSNMKISQEAERYAQLCGRSPAFCQAVLEEVKFRNGTVVGTCPGAMVTEVRPWQTHVMLSGVSSCDSTSERSRSTSLLPSLLTLRRRASTAPSAAATGSAQHDVHKSLGVILTANAGMDESKTPEGTAVGWPEDPVQSAHELKTNNYQLTTRRCAVLITDTCVRPRRWGVVAFALVCAGIDPFKDEAGNDDLFGKKLKITREARADQLSTAANILMGNAAQSVPAVIIRDHGIPMTNFVGWVPGIDPEEDLFKGIL